MIRLSSNGSSLYLACNHPCPNRMRVFLMVGRLFGYLKPVGCHAELLDSKFIDFPSLGSLFLSGTRSHAPIILFHYFAFSLSLSRSGRRGESLEDTQPLYRPCAPSLPLSLLLALSLPLALSLLLALYHPLLTNRSPHEEAQQAQDTIILCLRVM